MKESEEKGETEAMEAKSHPPKFLKGALKKAEKKMPGKKGSK